MSPVNAEIAIERSTFCSRFCGDHDFLERVLGWAIANC